MSINRGVDKDEVICIYNGILLRLKKKKNRIVPFTETWMQLEIIILGKSERERQIPYDITYMKNLNYGTQRLLHCQSLGTELLPGLGVEHMRCSIPRDTVNSSYLSDK